LEAKWTRERFRFYMASGAKWITIREQEERGNKNPPPDFDGEGF
jgi:hypothetical protein